MTNVYDPPPATHCNKHHVYTAAPLSVHRHEAATKGSTRPGRIEYEPYKRRAMSTLPSPTMSTSMYEVFNWGYANESTSASAGNTGVWSSTPFRTGKRMHFSIAGPQINIDDPPSSSLPNNRSSNADHCSSGGGGGAGGMGASRHSAKKGQHTFQQQQQHHQLLQGGADGIGNVVVPANGERKRQRICTIRRLLLLLPWLLLNSSCPRCSLLAVLFLLPILDVHNINSCDYGIGSSGEL